MRMVLGIVAGAAALFVCVFGIEILGHTVYPPPPDIDLSNPRDVERLMGVLPTGALAFVVAGWFVGALVGAMVANLIARRAVAGWIVALLAAAGAVGTMFMIPHPGWMWAAGIILPLLAAFVAARFTPAPA